jgi:hypothetical protein
VKQKIFYVPRPDPSLRSSPAQISDSLPGDVAPTPAPSMSSWPQQRLPTVIVRGVIFDRVNVEVECKVGNIHLIVLSVRLSLLFKLITPVCHFLSLLSNTFVYPLTMLSE